jgi:hypothetical protein
VTWLLPVMVTGAEASATVAEKDLSASRSGNYKNTVCCGIKQERAIDLAIFSTDIDYFCVGILFAKNLEATSVSGYRF